MYPEEFIELKESFQKLPGIGEKTAERMALSFVELKNNDKDMFIDSMNSCKSNLKQCSICGHITNKQICGICTDKFRKDDVICVLENYKSVIAFEKVGNFSGKYHVLNGLISPIDGINPEDINIDALIDRVNKLDKVELIIALKSTVEGETTSLYLQKIFDNKDITISRLSYGIPMGTDLDYLDEMTLDSALKDRKIVS